ncbi:MAG: hypothetical protein ACRDK0_06050, partial [Solirubrobacteraceae bacterium]
MGDGAQVSSARHPGNDGSRRASREGAGSTGEEDLMTHGPARHLCVAALALAAAAASPGSAGAHPADCASTALTPRPTAEAFVDWTAED